MLDTTNTDALHWAEEFCKTMKEQGWTLEDIDEGLMLAWFANYWAAVHDSLSDEVMDKMDTEQQKDHRKIAELIGSIYFNGNFVAETPNEMELEALLRKVGCFFETEADLMAALHGIELPEKAHSGC